MCFTPHGNFASTPHANTITNVSTANQQKESSLPVTIELLGQIIISLVCSSQYDVSLYSTMVSLAYHACPRIEEYCTIVNPNNVSNIDQVRHISRDGQLCALQIYFKKYKKSNSLHPVHENDFKKYCLFVLSHY